MSLKNKYSLFYILFCLAGCCLAGFVAVFLQFKGVSNTMIGLVTGLGCVSSVVLSPYLSNLIMKIEKLNAVNMTIGIYLVAALVFALLALLPLPEIIVVAGYILVYSLYVVSCALPQIMASGYMHRNMDIDFGLARGLGSASWAVTALVMGPIVDVFSPVSLAVVYVIAVVGMVLLLKTMPVAKADVEPGEKGGSAFDIIRNYQVYFLILTGFGFCIAGHSMLGTYLSNIVFSLGGSTTMFGIAVFCMALSEMPVMAKARKWMKKVDSLTLIVLGGGAYIIRNFTVCLAPNLPVLIIGLMFQSVSYGLLTAVVTFYAIYNLDSKDQVMGQAMVGIFTTGLGSTIGNLAGGFLQDIAGLQAMYMVACGLTVIGFVFMLMAKAKNKTAL